MEERNPCFGISIGATDTLVSFASGFTPLERALVVEITVALGLLTSTLTPSATNIFLNHLW